MGARRAAVICMRGAQREGFLSSVRWRLVFVGQGGYARALLQRMLQTVATEQYCTDTVGTVKL